MSEVATGQVKQVVRRFVEAVNRQDLGQLADLVAADVRRYSQSTPGVEVRSLDDLRALLRHEATIFSDVRITVDQLIGEGDRVALLGRWHAT